MIELVNKREKEIGNGVTSYCIDLLPFLSSFSPNIVQLESMVRELARMNTDKSSFTGISKQKISLKEDRTG